MANAATARREAEWRRISLSACSCRNCDLWATATQTVFGMGPVPADVMLVGEQPGDQEDRQGSPFVGPAGRLLNEALQAAGIDREKAYVTNAVKHFRWEPRGKRRIHRAPSLEQVRACRPWLEDELRLASPRALVLMGATAARALLGRGFKVSEQRGRALDSDLAHLVVATVHPSSILRQSDPISRSAEFERFVADLALVAHRPPAPWAPAS